MTIDKHSSISFLSKKAKESFDNARPKNFDFILHIHLGDIWDSQCKEWSGELPKSPFFFFNQKQLFIQEELLESPYTMSYLLTLEGVATIEV